MPKKGIFLVLLSAVMFGVMPVLVRVIYSNGGNASSAILYRLIIGCPVLWVCAKRQTKRLGQARMGITAKQCIKLVLCSFFYFSTSWLLVYSYIYIPSGLSTTLHFSYPFFTLLICLFAFREKVTRAGLLCCCLCLAGLICISSINDSVNAVGIILAISSGFTYSLFIIYLAKSEILESVPYFKANFYLRVFGVFMLLPLSIASGEFVMTLTPIGWIITILCGSVFDLIAMIAFQIGVVQVGPQMAAFFSVAEPIVSIITGSAVYGDVLPLRSVIGIILMLASVILVSVSSAGGSGKNSSGERV